MRKMDESSELSDSVDMTRFITELVSSPINLALLGLCAFLLYKIVKNRRREFSKSKQPELPTMKKRDFTLEQLQEFNGRGNDGRILVAVNGKVFDVTRGSRFYGPGTRELGTHVVSGVHNSAGYCPRCAKVAEGPKSQQGLWPR